MAEAHSAGTMRGPNDQELARDVWHGTMRSIKRKILRLRTTVRARLFPATPPVLAAIAGGICAIFAFGGKDATFGLLPLVENQLSIYSFGHVALMKWMSLFLSSALISLTLSQLLRGALRLMFTYRGWMYEIPGKPVSIPTKLWMGVVELLGKCAPGTQSYQGMLPLLPIPPLEETVEKHLRSMRPLLNDVEFSELTTLSAEFRDGIGRKLQRYLTLKGLFATNYVTDWWEEFVYLHQRSPLMINSNYYGTDSLIGPPTHVQSARAANITWAAMQFRELIKRQQLSPFSVAPQTRIPFCTAQYDRLFNGCRIPGEEKDALMFWNNINHIAVYAKGCWFKVLIHDGTRLLDPCELQHQLDAILSADLLPVPGEERLASLTAGERPDWALARTIHFSHGINKESLETIESAAFVLILDDEDVFYDPKDPSKLDAWAHSMLHGKAYNRWFDKTFNIVITKNARYGFNAEHSWGDGAVTVHCAEYVLLQDIVLMGYDEKGNTKGTPRRRLAPERLKWQIGEEAQSAIAHSFTIANALIADVEMALLVWNEFGKGLIKKLRVSPDAFLQMTLQLAYLRNQGKFCLTYEASMTRLFRSGRTETVRSCTMASCDFVRAMLNEKQTREERVRLLRVACDKHTELYKEAMCGNGVDRHLFALYIVKRYLNVDSPFFNKIFPPSFLLSTSQTPMYQCGDQLKAVSKERREELVSAGGGFGPAAEDGYGISYIISGESYISFHISSKRSCPATSSARMREDVIKSLREMKALFVADNGLHEK